MANFNEKFYDLETLHYQKCVTRKYPKISKYPKVLYPLYIGDQ